MHLAFMPLVTAWDKTPNMIVVATTCLQGAWAFQKGDINHTWTQLHAKMAEGRTKSTRIPMEDGALKELSR
jgi:hypothetical protein